MYTIYGILTSNLYMVYKIILLYYNNNIHIFHNYYYTMIDMR